MNGDELAWLSLAALSEAIHRGEVSSVEVTQGCLDRIERLDGHLNAFITVTADQALREAERADQELGLGQSRGPLHGVPIGIKDLCDTAGVLTTAASGVFADRVPDEDAEVVRRLRDAGAVSLGKLNMHEFAYGGTSHISHYGPPRNPWAPEHIAGGSSGGSATAVAAALCYGALGTDTGGSIREPAALCGIVGLKPTHGLVSTRGVVPLSWTLDHVGPMTRTVEDAALLLDAIAGSDPHDIGSVDRAPECYWEALRQELGSLRVGVPRQRFYEDLDAGVEAVVDEVLGCMSGAGAEIREVELPMHDPDALRAISGRVLQAEAFAFHRQLLTAHPDRYHPDTRSRAERGAIIAASEYIEAHRRLLSLRREVASMFAEVDVLVTPTVPRLAPRFDELEDRDIGIGLLRNTSPFNAYGLPTISIPAGVAYGLPVGVQITAAPFADAFLLRVAAHLEKLLPGEVRAGGSSSKLLQSLGSIQPAA